MKMIYSSLKRLCKEEDGQDLVEYSLLLAFLALGSIGLLSGAKTSVKSVWTHINTSLTSAAAS